MTKRRRFLLIIAAIPVVLVVLFFATANYSNDGRRVRYINRAPIASVSWGPSEFYIVRDGINIVWEATSARRATSSNFPLPLTRVFRCAYLLGVGSPTSRAVAGCGWMSFAIHGGAPARSRMNSPSQPAPARGKAK